MIKVTVSWFKKQIMAFYLCLIRLQVHSIGKCKNNSLRNILLSVYLKAKILNNSLIHSDADENELKRFSKVALRLLDIEGGDNDDSSGDDLNDIQAFVGKVLDDDSEFIKEAKSDYESTKTIDSELRAYLEKCKSDLDHFSYDTFHEKLRTAGAQCGAVKKKYRDLSKKMSNELQDARREPHKYDISELGNWHVLAKLAGSLGAAFVVFASAGGYVYVWALFGQLGFRFSGFFTAADYLVTPLSRTLPVIILVSVIYFFLLAKRVDMASESKRMSDLREEQNRKYMDPLFLLIIVGLIIAGLVSRSVVLLLIGGLIALMLYGVPRVVSRYIKPSVSIFKAVTFVIACIIYFVYILMNANSEYLGIINSQIKNEMTVYLDDGGEIKNQIYIMKNDRYFFYYNLKEKRVDAIPENKIKRVSSTKSN